MPGLQLASILGFHALGHHSLDVHLERATQARSGIEHALVDP
jgi:hypothetical protein